MDLSPCEGLVQVLSAPSANLIKMDKVNKTTASSDRAVVLTMVYQKYLIWVGKMGIDN